MVLLAEADDELAERRGWGEAAGVLVEVGSCMGE